MTIQTAGFNERGLRHVLGLALDALEEAAGDGDMPKLWFESRSWLALYDHAPAEENYAGNVPNTHLVGEDGAGELAIIRLGVGKISKDDALHLAAWLSVLADPLDERFALMRRAVLQS